jgi:hypothetical protein
MLEEEPTSAFDFPPREAEPYKVRTGEDWRSIAERFGMDVWELIEFNFPVVGQTKDFQSKCRQVNWCLRVHVGSSRSSDGKNYSFDSADSPGRIYVPNAILREQYKWQNWWFPK